MSITHSPNTPSNLFGFAPGGPLPVDPIGSPGGRRIRTALFVDFDNLFSGLFRTKRDIAMAFAESPEVWLEALTTYGLTGDHRDVLVRRAYLNPEGSIADSESGSNGRLWLSRFRSNLTRAGFEVVDCPPLCSSQKNAADIRMVLDVRDLLDMPVAYDEFVIASSDSDFTPLLNRLRALDRRTVIMTTDQTSRAYRSIAHQVLSGDDVAELAGMPPAAAEAEPAEATAARDEVIGLIRRTVTEDAGSVHLGSLGNAIREIVPKTIVDDTRWFGGGSLGGFIKSLPDGFAVDGHIVRHPSHAPDAADSADDADHEAAPADSADDAAA